MTELNMESICGQVNKISAHSDGETTHVVIESICKKLQAWGTEFDVPMENLMDMQETIFAEKSKNGKLTPTCFVPSMIVNAVWLENGMISKSLVHKMSPIKINFVDE